MYVYAYFTVINFAQTIIVSRFSPQKLPTSVDGRSSVISIGLADPEVDGAGAEDPVQPKYAILSYYRDIRQGLTGGAEGFY